LNHHIGNREQGALQSGRNTELEDLQQHIFVEPELLYDQSVGTFGTDEAEHNERCGHVLGNCCGDGDTCDIHVEAVVRARPDLAVLPTDKTGNRGHLESLGIPVLTLDTRTLPGLMRDIEALGKATGRSAEAEAILERFRMALAEATARSHGKRKPRVLFSVMHAYEGLGYITQINAVGRDGFYNQLIEAAGGENVYTGSLPFPRLSREAVIFLNPDVIIDVIPTHEDLEAVRRDWETLRNVNAIRNNRLYFLTDVADTVPGPRSPGTLEKLIRAFHPEEEAPATAPSAPHGAEAPHAPSAASPERNPL